MEVLSVEGAENVIDGVSSPEREPCIELFDTDAGVKLSISIDVLMMDVV